MNKLLTLLTTLFIVGLIGCSTGADFSEQQIGNWKLKSASRADYNPQPTAYHQKLKFEDTLYIDGNNYPDYLDVSVRTFDIADTSSKKINFILSIVDFSQDDSLSGFHATAHYFMKSKAQFYNLKPRNGSGLTKPEQEPYIEADLRGKYKCEQYSSNTTIGFNFTSREDTTIHRIYKLDADGLAETLNTMDICN